MKTLGKKGCHRFVTELRDTVIYLRRIKGGLCLGSPEADDTAPTPVKVVRFCSSPSCERIFEVEPA